MEWISVEDRLPSVSTDTLLVSVKTNHGEYLSDTDGYDHKLKQFAYWGLNGDITHWAYLPLPPPIEI